MMHVDDVQFRLPVEIGDLLRLNARIIATHNPDDSEHSQGATPLLGVEVRLVSFFFIFFIFTNITL